MKNKKWKMRDDAEHYFYVSDEKGHMVCDEISSQEDAQLIAAAPELLKVCKNILRGIEVDEKYMYALRDIVNLRDAIKKAEETPQENKSEDKYLEIYTPLQDVQLMKKETGVDIKDCVGRIISIWSDGSFCINEENEDKTAKAKLCISIVELQLPIKINGFCDKKNLSLIDGNNYKHVWEADGNTFFYLLNPDKPDDKYLEIYTPLQSINAAWYTNIHGGSSELKRVEFTDCIGRVISININGNIYVDDKTENKAAKKVIIPTRLNFPIKLYDCINGLQVTLKDGNDGIINLQRYDMDKTIKKER